MWCDPASLLTSRIRMELGPLGPAPAHFGLSFHDGLDVRLRGGIRRAGVRISILGDNSAEHILNAVGGGCIGWAFDRYIHSLRI